MVSIISSMFASATVKPSKMWPRSRALRNSYIVRRVTTSWRWRINAAMMSFKFINFGWPLSRQTMLILKEFSNCVFWNKLFTMTSAFSPRFKSIAIRIPSLSDSSRSSEIPSSFFSLTNSAIRSIVLALLTWYGISVKTIVVRPFLGSSSKWYLPRICRRPLPVRYASTMPDLP